MSRSQVGVALSGGDVRGPSVGCGGCSRGPLAGGDDRSRESSAGGGGRSQGSVARSAAEDSGYVQPPEGIGVPHADRAHIFMPFAALRGYYDLVREQERVPEPKRLLTEEDALRLSQTLTLVRKGDMVRITYYDQGAYESAVARVSQVDLAYRCLHLDCGKVCLDDVADLEVLGPSGCCPSEGE